MRLTAPDCGRTGIGTRASLGIYVVTGTAVTCGPVVPLLSENKKNKRKMS